MTRLVLPFFQRHWPICHNGFRLVADHQIMQVPNQRRIFKWKGVAGACLRPGSQLGPPTPIGDSWIMNFETGFFAVCDGSDRNPQASWKFLIQFERMVANTAAMKLAKPLKTHQLIVLKEKFDAESRKLLNSALGSFIWRIPR